MIKWVIIVVIAIAVLALVLYHVLPVVSAVRAVFQQEPEGSGSADESGGQAERE